MKNIIFISPNFPTNYWQFCKELKNNPNLELAASSPTFEWLRISGKAAFVDDADLKRKLTKESEISESVYKNSKDSDFEIFYFEINNLLA